MNPHGIRSTGIVVGVLAANMGTCGPKWEATAWGWVGMAKVGWAMSKPDDTVQQSLGNE